MEHNTVEGDHKFRAGKKTENCRVWSGKIYTAGNGVELETQNANSRIHTSISKHHIMQGI